MRDDRGDMDDMDDRDDRGDTMLTPRSLLTTCTVIVTVSSDHQ